MDSNLSGMAKKALEDLFLIRKLNKALEAIEARVAQINQKIEQKNGKLESDQRALELYRAYLPEMQGAFTEIKLDGDEISYALYALERKYRGAGDEDTATEAGIMTWPDSHPGGRMNEENRYTNLTAREASLIKEAIELKIAGLEEAVKGYSLAEENGELIELGLTKIELEAQLDEAVVRLAFGVVEMNLVEMELFLQEYGYEYVNGPEDLKKMMELRLKNYGVKPWEGDNLFHDYYVSMDGKTPLIGNSGPLVNLEGDYHVATGLFLRPVECEPITILYYNGSHVRGHVQMDGTFVHTQRR